MPSLKKCTPENIQMSSVFITGSSGMQVAVLQIVLVIALIEPSAIKIGVSDFPETRISGTLFTSLISA